MTGARAVSAAKDRMACSSPSSVLVKGERAASSSLTSMSVRIWSTSCATRNSPKVACRNS